MKKILIAAVMAGMTGGAYAADFSDLAVRASDLKASFGMFAAQNDIRVPAPALAASGPASRAFGQQQGEDAVVNSLTEAQWNNILGSQPWEATDEPAVSKELYSDYHIRYIAKGRVSFRTTPPTFTTESGKVFVVTKYPKWLKEVGDTKICVEGYAKQRDDTSEFIIKKMLPPSALEGVLPSAGMQALQRDPSIISHDESGYVLGNLNWNLAHAADGARVKDQYGNFISEWQSGVVVKPELLEAAYFVKKTSLKPVRYGDHGYLMFKFKPGGVMTADGKNTRFIVVSLDAYYKDQSNMSYSAVTALKRQYLVYYSIQTAERYTEFKLSEDPQSLTVYPLALTRGQRLQKAGEKMTRTARISRRPRSMRTERIHFAASGTLE